jgi:hypothetical protein
MIFIALIIPSHTIFSLRGTIVNEREREWRERKNLDLMQDPVSTHKPIH